MTVKVLKGIREIVEKYDGFILDQYGVLHDGQKAFDGVTECLDLLKKAKKRIIVLSNTSRRSKDMMERFESLGLPGKDLFDGAVTSGEQAFAYISENCCSQSCFLVTHHMSLKNVEVPFSTSFRSIDNADFILVQGVDHFYSPENGFISNTGFGASGTAPQLFDLLQQGVRRGIHMLCSNPDIVSRQPDGSLHYRPGQIAKFYESIGGTVVYFGKPFKSHFDECIKMLGCPRDKVVHIGDSLEHDIKGAISAGIDSVFVVDTGIHANAFDIDGMDHLSMESLEIVPTFAISSFTF